MRKIQNHQGQGGTKFRIQAGGANEILLKAKDPKGETFSAENASTIRQFCYAKLPGGRSRREGAVSGFAAGK